jgi:hypothetical protein
MTGPTSIDRAVVARWVLLALVMLLPPGFVVFGIGLVWVVALGQEGRAGVVIAAGMSLVAVLTNAIVYAGV